MILTYQPKYLKEYKKLTKDIFVLSDKALRLFKDNISHNSLEYKHIICKRNRSLYSIRVNKDCRILLTQIDDNSYEVMRVLNHDKYDRLTKDC